MTLSAGTRLGSHEILSLLGSGGMGEVYRARDSKLKRDVAIKVLRDATVPDPDRLARFHREAELLATLNHPNVGAVYGLEESGGATAIVLELVEGETPADRIARGPVPIEDALPIARQIADALDAAHERGVVHRDLKPSNIKITTDGRVKVLDFGLAKMLEHEGAAGALTMSPTLSVHATRAGVILGTAAYMSPEQARGKPVDRRTDVWSFGCVLFEMLTGRRTFEAGDSVSDAIATILKKRARLDAVAGDHTREDSRTARSVSPKRCDAPPARHRRRAPGNRRCVVSAGRAAARRCVIGQTAIPGPRARRPARRRGLPWRRTRVDAVARSASG